MSIQSLVASFMRKRPDLVDVFEEGKPNYEHMTNEFEKLVKNEF